ncbi:MAG: uracil-DNA glycosylase [Nitrospirae bacterium]|nr:MAG: uracil-DNA glycosylase [Nitrospirota bacterium]
MGEELRAELARALAAQRELGLTEVPARWLELARRRSTAPPRSAPPPAAGGAAPPAAAAGDDPRPGAPDLATLAALAAACQRCPLSATRTQVVFGVGDPQARLMLVGEAPGAEEDRQGEPFVGRAGQLLTRILAAIGLRREEVYIANVLKCRPPRNRDPEASEVAACRPFLERQIALVAPEVILCLGAFAARAVLETEAPIGALRGRFHDRRGVAVRATYHPAYLLRNPAAKRPVWEDVKEVARRLGLPEPFPGERGS